LNTVIVTINFQESALHPRTPRHPRANKGQARFRHQNGTGTASGIGQARFWEKDRRGFGNRTGAVSGKGQARFWEKDRRGLGIKTGQARFREKDRRGFGKRTGAVSGQGG
jgi:hypothetical protein